MRELLAALRALLYMTGFILLWGWLALGVRPYDARLGMTLPAWSWVAGVLVMAAGGTLVLTCAGLFAVRGRGTPALFDPPREFIAVGPYRYVRNPMYIGGWLLLMGFGLWHRSVSMLLFALLVILLFHLFVVLIEERGLKERFGESYRDYKRSVNRWRPKWR